MSELAALLLLVLLVGVVLLVVATRGRRRRGLGPGETVSLDDRTLISERLGLVGRPDRLIQEGMFVIPEEWKPSARQVSPGHRLQLGAYLLLVEEEFGMRPHHGWVVIRDGERVRVRNTERLRSEVLAVAEAIREHRPRLSEEIPVRPPAAKCRACGQRRNCGQSRS